MAAMWTWLKKNFGAVLNGAIVLIGIAIAWLDMTGRANSEDVQEATLALLALIGASLLTNHATNSQLQQATRDILRTNQATDNELRKAKGEILERLHKASALSEVITPYNDKMPEISGHIKQADEVWVLARTCRMLWTDYQAELEVPAGRNGLKLLFIDPDNGALDMVARSATWWQPDDSPRLKEDVKRFINRLELAQKSQKLDNFEVRLLDHLPAWSLILVNPRKDDGVIYVEFATYRSHHRKRPGFVVRCGLDNNLFNLFRNEFEQMWDAARPAWENCQVLHQG